MKTITPSMINNDFSPVAKKELKKIQKNYLETKAEHATLKAVENAAEDQACEELELITEEDFEPADHHNSYMLSDADFDKMLTRRQEILLTQGYNCPDKDFALSHDAWQRLRRAENDIFKWMHENVRERIGVTEEELDRMVNHWKYSKQLIELTLKLTV